MSWLCLNCETVNFDAENRCIVCSEERYYSASEVRALLENHPETKALREQTKKLNTQNKWLQTRNKNLSQENKKLQEELEYKNLPSQDRKELPTTFETEEKTNEENLIEEKLIKLQMQWKKKVLIWQISTIVATCVALFLLVYRL
mgnify:CR=1 FL=1